MRDDHLTFGGVAVKSMSASSWDGPFVVLLADGSKREFATFDELTAEAKRNGFSFDGIDLVGKGRAADA